jgi:DNA-binding Lrp family transcriptional regulator
MKSQRTLEKRRIPEILSSIRQNSKQQTEQYVLDMLDIWYDIHKLTEEATLENALTISQSILETHIIPFFNKYKNGGNLQRHQGWIDTFASIYLKWNERGGFLFPLTLVFYEITYRDKGLLFDILTQLRTGLIQGTSEELHEIIFPVLANFTVPLDDVDIDLLKAHQTLQPLKSLLFKSPENKSFAEVLEVSTRTIIRRLKMIRLLQLVNTSYFLDMGKLGYETRLLVHSNEFPKKFMKYLLLSSNLSIGNFSIVQIPSIQYDVQSALQEKLDILVSNNLSRRITSWNLSGLSSGEDIWTNPPPFFFTQPKLGISTPSTDVDMSLKPTFDTFRELTRADFKILDFIVREGIFKNLNSLSKSINVNRLEISNRLKEYSEENLTAKTHQFYNIALDLSIFFFISDVDTKIPWLSHLLTFPKIDVFTQKEESPNTYFGYLKLPNKWIKPFARKIDLIRNEHDVKIYYKIASAVDHFKWGISLADTYHHR